MYMYLIIVCIVICLPLLLKYLIKQRSKKQLPHLRKNSKGEKTVVVGFFHPYCNAGGGGERVLWTAIRALQKKYPKVQCIVYTGDTDTTGQEILDKARQRFNIVLKSSVEFIVLKRRRWVEAEKYPYFTLLGQSLGSMVLGLEALLAFVPDIYIDSMGYAFTLPLFKYLGDSKTVSYVHYPTISTDMLQRVANRTQAHNNASFISRSPVLSFAKLQYYRLFACLYGIMGRKSDIIMVNSTWTYEHIKQLWHSPNKTFIIYPPCDIAEFTKLSLEKSQLSKIIISIAQFRPEKDHCLQISSFCKFLSSLEENDRKNYKLLLVGSCRNEGDSKRVEELKQLCSKIKVEDYVEFKLNVNFDELKDLMSKSIIGIHTMWNEHFGIGVVELMAAGTVVLAHNSGGPKLDIVTKFNQQKTGFLADDVESYACAMKTIFNLTKEERLKIMENARESVDRFSEDKFEKEFLSVSESIFVETLSKF